MVAICFASSTWVAVIDVEYQTPSRIVRVAWLTTDRVASGAYWLPNGSAM